MAERPTIALPEYGETAAHNLCTALLRQPPPEGLQTVFSTGPAGSKNIHPLLEF